MGFQAPIEVQQTAWKWINKLTRKGLDTSDLELKQEPQIGAFASVEQVSDNTGGRGAWYF